MGKFIISNNEKVFDMYDGICESMFVNGGYMDVLIEVRNKIHIGYKLLSHPMAGSMKPNQTPFRSVVLETHDSIDLESLNLIENSIITAQKFLSRRNTPKWNDRILDDFRTIDASLIKSTLEKSGIKAIENK